VDASSETTTVLSLSDQRLYARKKGLGSAPQGENVVARSDFLREREMQIVRITKEKGRGMMPELSVINALDDTGELVNSVYLEYVNGEIWRVIVRSLRREII
jgi:hypothetical protein